MTKFQERKRSKESTLKTKSLTMSKQPIVDIPPEPKSQKLSLVQLNPISIAPEEPPFIEISKPPPQPLRDKVFTLGNFMECAEKADDSRARRAQAAVREQDMLRFRRMLNLPPKPGFPLSHI